MNSVGGLRRDLARVSATSVFGHKGSSMNKDSASNMQTINAIVFLTNMCGSIVTVVAFVIIPRRYLVAYRTLRTWDRKVTLFDRNSNCSPGCLRHKACGVFFFLSS